MNDAEKRELGIELMMTREEWTAKGPLVIDMAAALRSGGYVDLTTDSRYASGARRAWNLPGGVLVHGHGRMSIRDGMKTAEINELDFFPYGEEAYRASEMTRCRYEMSERGYRINAWNMIRADEAAARKALVKP